ncbi:DJ-1/PfpI family protein [Streptococcus didelphis]|uniref:DJ-1/PfpI family protein n=2 Tax=Streptococcus didelphis TaxID=102886 RepID=A0ABY9LKH6_9STRE|nr:DJ-1/PfpI family protein [Streptococcus didelphis]WMB28586.1 DJ-1/PfpI family protein [Streptococcus didelphis]
MKIALLIYPQFSLYEITPLTSQLRLHFQQTIDLIASQKKLYSSEEGIQVMPNYSLSEIDLSSYQLVLLSGTMAPFQAVNDEEVITALSKLDLTKIVVASISSSPLLLARANLLNERQFTGGLYSNYFGTFSWLKEGQFLPRQCVVIDKNLITAIGSSQAVEIFTRLVLAKLNFTKDWPALSEEEISFTLEKNDFQKMLEDMKRDYPKLI